MGCRRGRSKRDEFMDCAPATPMKNYNMAAEVKKKSQNQRWDKNKPRVIVVFGATGRQGGSVARAMQRDPRYKVLAVTRKPDSPDAERLRREGLEVVQANLDDQDSVDQVVAGAYGVFLVTNYWEHCDVTREVTQGTNVVEACRLHNVHHLVYSGLENVNKAIGKPCPPFDAKAEVERYILHAGVPYTIVRYATYMENLLDDLKPKKKQGRRNDFVLCIPMNGMPLDMVPLEGTGKCILNIFNDRDRFIGRSVGLSAERLKIDEYGTILSKKFPGRTFEATDMTTVAYGEQEEKGAQEKSAMFEFYQSGSPDRDIDLTLALNPHIQSFEEWIDANRSAMERTLTESS